MSLPLGTIVPRGWIRRQLRIQADGLSGHLDEFWPDIRDSGWIGGEAEGWERAPYWLDGLVPLAFLLDDADLIAKVDRWIGYIVDHQQVDGWLGPVAQAQNGFLSDRDPWPLFVMLKVLTQYAEARAEDSPGRRTYDVIVRTLAAINTHIDKRPLYSWNQYRWADLLVTILWCRVRERLPWMDTLAERIHNQGYDWDEHFSRFAFSGKSDRWTFDRHVVNNAMGLKSPGLWEMYTKGAITAESVQRPITVLDEHHGQATGMFTGDECLAGRMPSQGTELCAVVEYLYSLEQILAHHADVALSDRLELIAFNALPAPFSPDMWAHQYDQQVNQALCAIVEDNLYTSNRSDANLYGLEPHFGCCTANMHQGFPKLVSSLWVRMPEGGLRALSYVPCELVTQIAGSRVRLEVTGGYPLRDEVLIRLDAEQAGAAPAEATLALPVPAWAHGATLSVDDASPVPVSPGAVATVTRSWVGSHRIRLRLPMSIRVEFRYNGAASVFRGPLLYALQPHEEWTHLRGEAPHADFQVQPGSEWNLAIALRAGDGSFGLRAEEYDLADDALTAMGAAESAPLPRDERRSEEEPRPRSAFRIPVTARTVAGWELEHGAAAPPPQSPVEPQGVARDLYLVPYAGTGLRIAEIPWYWDDTQDAPRDRQG